MEMGFQTGIKSATSGSPNGLTKQLVSVTASPSVIFTGGQNKLKSNVNSYVPGEQAQMSTPISWLCVCAVARKGTRRPMPFHKEAIGRLRCVVLECCFVSEYSTLSPTIVFEFVSQMKLCVSKQCMAGFTTSL